MAKLVSDHMDDGVGGVLEKDLNVRDGLLLKSIAKPVFCSTSSIAHVSVVGKQDSLGAVGGCCIFLGKRKEKKKTIMIIEMNLDFIQRDSMLRNLAGITRPFPVMYSEMKKYNVFHVGFTASFP